MGDPVLRTTQTGVSVCSFRVAVNRRVKAGAEAKADYFDISAWRERGETCAKYLSKGKKVCVVGSVSIREWETDSKHGAVMEVVADQVEFLSPRQEATPVSQVDAQSGMQVAHPEDLPF